MAMQTKIQPSPFTPLRAALKADLQARIRDLNREVRNAPPSRYGTDWMHDRRREIAALEGRLAQLSE